MFCNSPPKLNNQEQVITFTPLIVTPDTPLAKAIALMSNAQATRISKDTVSAPHDLFADARASCVLIVEDNQLVGIFTERDVVRLIANGQKIAGVAIADVMTHSVVTLKQSEFTNLSVALSLFQHYQIRHLPVLDDDGAVIGSIAQESLLQYLAARVESEQILRNKQIEALRQSEYRYATLASAAPVGIFRTDVKGNCMYVNDRWCEIAGLTSVEAIGIGWVKALHPDDQALIFEEWNRSVREKEPFRLEYRFQRSDGKVTWVFGQAVAEQGANGQTTGYIGTITDISDRKQAQTDLQNLVEGAVAVTGHDFFPALVKYIAAALDVDYVVVAKLEGNSLTTYALCANGQIQPNISFSIENTPCAQSMANGMFCCAEGVQQLFSSVELLSALEAESYLSIALIDIRGNVIGNLAILDKKPLTNIPRITAILQIFAARVSAELERQQAMEALCRLNQELELRIEQRTSALRESEERWQLALRGSNDGIWDWNLKTNQVFFSTQWKDMRGFTEDEIGDNLEEWLSRIHPSHRDRVIKSIKEHFAGKTPFFQEEYQVEQKDGSYMWVLDRGQALWDEEGNAIRMAGSETDITERKQAEEILQHQLAAIEAVIDGIAILEGETYTYLNKAHLELFGYESPEELVGSTWKKLYSPEEISRFEQEVFPTLMQQRYWQGEATGTRKDGSTFAEGLSLTMTESGDLICVCRDISKRKQVEEQLRRMNEQLNLANAELHQATRLKDEFLANMSHELRTPLNAILGMSEGLQEEVFGQLNDRQKHAIATIERSGKHLLELINDILDLSKIESGKLELQTAPVAVNYLCKSSVAFVRQQAIKKNLQLTVEVPNDLPEIVVDERRIRQVLINLLNNAVKFTPSGGSVKLVVQPKEQQETIVLCFSVIDTGIGIPQEEMSKLFQPFVQIDSSLNRQHTGTGLGLALVRQLVELHGGTVAVTSEVSQGSCFTVCLPYVRCFTSLFTPTSQALNYSTLLDKNSQVLIVEDSSVAAEQIARYLSELNMDAAIYDKGEGAIDAALRIQPSLIFLDLLLPNLSGWEVLKQLKAHPQTKNIPVVVISLVDERSQALSLGAAEYLVKPMTREKFRYTLDKVQHPEQFPATALIIAPNPPIEATSPPLILLAEDNEANIATISSYLGARGYRLIVARNGREAVSLAKAQHPDLIIMDIQMPGMDGLEAMRLLRADGKFLHTPIVALTALAMPGDRENCISAGANEYLTKPVKLKLLVETIKHLI
ncbi:PAS domain S-box protein [Scytonema sp. UIC 10036]|uniref:PAS domain S-box protein n=1 Tax=Scytonema sp. UIC 10036 TaxID=2304196 RepID=UPI00140F8E85|nr:PAS domain S-box protein [Scytonema sp. UIC 10036]